LGSALRVVSRLPSIISIMKFMKEEIKHTHFEADYNGRWQWNNKVCDEMPCEGDIIQSRCVGSVGNLKIAIGGLRLF
jgi:hypothetical protein